jgi:Short C-terminal domain
MGPGPGIPGWFIAVFIVFVMAAIGMTIWRVSVARRMAEDAGLDPKRATAVAMLSNDGIDATYLASTLASHSRAQPPHPAQVAKTAEQRLQELQALRDKGLVTDDEYETQRQKILGSI